MINLFFLFQAKIVFGVSLMALPLVINDFYFAITHNIDNLYYSHIVMDELE